MTTTELASEYQKVKRNYRLTSSFEPKVDQNKENASNTTRGERTIADMASTKKVNRTNLQPLELPTKQTKRTNTATRACPPMTKSTAKHSPSTEYNSTMRTRTVTKYRWNSSKKTMIDHQEEAITDESKDPPKTLQPLTAKSGYQHLGLSRPDDKHYEFGLDNGIEVHLVESIKLCGLRKAREKSIIDMISTLCSHLTNREEDVREWQEFSDSVAIAAAERIERHALEYKAVVEARDEAYGRVNDLRVGLEVVQKEAAALREELKGVLTEISQTMSSFSPDINDTAEQVQHRLVTRLESVRSECKTEMVDAIDDVERVHEEEKLCWEATIQNWKEAFEVERDKAAAVQTQLNDKMSELETERNEQCRSQTTMQRIGDELLRANNEIARLNTLLKDKESKKQKELDEIDDKMKRELDDIDARVKRSFKALIDSKNKEIEQVMQRAEDAEASAKSAAKVLAQLKERVTPMIISTSEGSSEK